MKTMAESFDISPAEQIIAAKKKKRIKKICTGFCQLFFPCRDRDCVDVSGIGDAATKFYDA